MTYYSNSAYKASQQPSAANSHEVFTENSIDVRDFPPLEEYLQLDNCKDLWPGPKEVEQRLKTASGAHKQHLELIKNTHRFSFFAAMDNSTMTAFMVHSIKSIGIIGTLSYFYLMIFLVPADQPNKAIYIYVALIPGIIATIIGKLLEKYYVPTLESKHNYTFDRKTGQVHVKRFDAEYDLLFKDFYPKAKRYYRSGGSTHHEVYMVHRQTLLHITISNKSLIYGVIMYNYLKHFMDTSRPLPDVPEFENYRQYDPVTKAHDEKTNRKKDYWARTKVGELEEKIKLSKERIIKEYGKNVFDY